MVYEVKDQEDWDKQLEAAGEKLVVVDFHATWCGPCRMIAPKITALSEEFTDVVFLKVDVDECEELAEKWGISAMPTFIYIKKGEKIDDVTGANYDKIKENLEKHRKC